MTSRPARAIANGGIARAARVCRAEESDLTGDLRRGVAATLAAAEEACRRAPLCGFRHFNRPYRDLIRSASGETSEGYGGVPTAQSIERAKRVALRARSYADVLARAAEIGRRRASSRAAGDWFALAEIGRTLAHRAAALEGTVEECEGASRLLGA